MTSTKRFAFALVLCAAATPAVAQDVTFAIEDLSVDVAPGSHADIPVVITNNGSTTSIEQAIIMPVHGERYAFEQESDGCGPIVPYTESGGWRQFAVDPLAAGQSRTCIVRVDRPADVPDNMYADWFIQNSTWQVFEIGTFTDLVATMTRVGATLDFQGMVHATYRLDTRNAGAVGFTGALIKLGEECASTSIEVDMDFPGGCAFAEVGCPWEGQGPGTLVSLEPGESSSCLVRYSAPTEFDTHVFGGLMGAMIDSETGGWIGDDDWDNNSFRIDVAEGASPAITTPALSAWSMLVLGLTLAALALSARRRAL